jgi:pyruvate carboxylase
VARAYAEANQLFGDIIKVTPSSKVVGDMALMMVTQELTAADVLDPNRDIAFPESVMMMMRGELGQPHGGWPEAIQKKVLKGQKPITVRPGTLLPPADMEAERAALGEKLGRQVSGTELASYLMYPKVFTDFSAAQEVYGPTEALPTPVYFYGLPPGREIAIELESGKILIVRCQAIGETDERGFVRVFFELNGQPRIARVPNRASGAAAEKQRPKADIGNAAHIAAPMPGVVSGVAVTAGQAVRPGDVLCSIEAMKMETAIHADRAGSIGEVLVKAGDQIDAKDLLMTYAA